MLGLEIFWKIEYKWPVTNLLFVTGISQIIWGPDCLKFNLWFLTFVKNFNICIIGFFININIRLWIIISTKCFNILKIIQSKIRHKIQTCTDRNFTATLSCLLSYRQVVSTFMKKRYSTGNKVGTVLLCKIGSILKFSYNAVSSL